MNKLIIFYFLIVYIFLQGCIRQPNVRQELRKPEIRREIINNIIADHGLMDELLDSMMMHDNARVMIKYHVGLMKMMMDDSTMMQLRMSNMIGDGRMMTSMMQKMNRQCMLNIPYTQSFIKPAVNGMPVNMEIAGEVSANDLK